MWSNSCYSFLRLCRSLPSPRIETGVLDGVVDRLAPDAAEDLFGRVFGDGDGQAAVGAGLRSVPGLWSIWGAMLGLIHLSEGTMSRRSVLRNSWSPRRALMEKSQRPRWLMGTSIR